MRLHITSIVTILGLIITVALAPSTAGMGATKTVKECNAEYAANKDAIQSGGQKKADFVAACRAGTEVIPGGAAGSAAPSATTAPAASAAAPRTTTSVKTVKECDAEYAANKAAIQGAGQKKTDFVSACRVGTEVIPTTAAAAPKSTTQPSTTAIKPSPQPTRTTPSAPNATVAPTGANQFASEAQAKSHCPGRLVVWVNLQSQIFHFSGYKNYGTTKEGAYMCEADATAEGARAAKGEKQPS